MKTFIKTLLVAVTILFSVFATAKQVKLPNNIKYVNTTEAFAYFHERRSLNNFHRDRVITFEQIAE
ncbi:hypothetical protein WI101_000493 [Escherichia coli]